MRLSLAAILLLLIVKVTFSQTSGISRVWAVDDGERIVKTNITHPLATSSSNKVWNGSSVSLFGARNEVVAFQLIIQGNGSGASGVNVTLDSLRKTGSPSYTIKNTGGFGDPYNYVGKRIEMFVEHYMNITDRTNASYMWWSSARPLPDTDYTGLLPEILVPFEAAPGARSHGQGGAPFTVTASQNQGVWVDIYIPRDAEAGDYSGTLKVTENSVLRYNIPVNLKVYNFVLPDSSHVRNAFLFVESALTSRHGLSSKSAGYWNMVRKYYALLYRHRANGQHTADTSSFKAQLAQVYNGTYFTAANGYAGPGEGIGPNYYAIGGFDQPNRVPGATEVSDSGWSQFAGGNYYAMRGRGEWSPGVSYQVNDIVHDNDYPFWYWCKNSHTSSTTNEPQESGGGTTGWKKYWQRLYDRGDQCGFAFNPDTAVMKQNYWRAADWWVNWFTNNNPSAWIMKYGPEEPNIEDSITDTSAFADVRRKIRWLRSNPSGRILKFRTATRFDAKQWPMNQALDVIFNGPSQTGYGGVIIDSVEAAQARGQRVGLYGGTRPHWGVEVIDAPAIDMRMKPWAMWKYGLTEYSYWLIGNFGNRNHWDQDRNAYGSVRKYGDGTLVYPGEDDLFPGDSRGLTGPLAGIRLKNWRRGAQDYEYLYLARQMGLDVTALVDTLIPAAFDEVPGSTQARFAQRGYSYDSIRRQVADLIALNNQPFPSGTLTATPNSLPGGGGNVTLSWASSYAATATMDNGIGPVSTNGSITVSVQSSTTFHLTLANSAGSQTLTAPVTVAGVLPPPDGTLIISPDTLPAGGGVATLIWVSSHATSATFDNGIGSVAVNGTLPVNVDTTTTFLLTLSSLSGSVNIQKTVIVRTPPPIPSGTFFATPDSLPVGGGSVTLVWVSSNATGASIDNGIGSVPTSGSYEVFVANPHTYALTLSNQTGSRVLSVPIRVAGTPPLPNGTFSISPDSLPSEGGNVTLNWTSSNATAASLDNGIGPVLLNGSLTISVVSSRVFRLHLSNAAGSQDLVVPVHVEGTTQPPTGTFVASPDSLPPGGGDVTLVWVSYDATTAAINNGIGGVPLNGSQSVFVDSSRTYALTISNSAGSNILSTSVRVGTLISPPSGSFSASPDTLPSSGGNVTLVWTSQNATSATIDNGVGSVPLNGSLSIPVTASTTFHLTLISASGTYELAVPVVVRGITQPPTGTFVVTPDTLPADGGEVTLVWVSSNASTGSIDNGIGTVSVNGSLTLLVSTSQTFVLTLSNAAGSQVLSASVRVAGTAALPSGTFSASPDTLPPGGGNVTLSWSSHDATSALIDNGVGAVPLNGSIAVVVPASTVFRLTLSSPTGVQEFVVPVFVQAATQPPTGTFVAIPDSLPVGGGNVTLAWFSSNATNAFIDNGIGAVAVSGLETVFVADTRTFALTLSNVAGSRVFTASVRVVGAAPSPTGTLSASPDTLPPGGGNVRLTWTSLNATSASIDNGIGSVALDGSLTVPVASSTVFRLSLSNATGTYEISVPIVVQTPIQLPSGTFVASPDTLPAGGGNATLVWATSNALSAAIDNGIGTVPLAGSQSVGLTASKNFRLSLSNAGGTATLGTSVIVAGTAPAPTATLIATPDTLPANGGPVTLIWVSSNATSVSFDNGIGNVPLNGSLTVNVASTKTIHMTVSNSSGSYSTSVRVRVASPDHVPGGTFIAIPDSLPPTGGTVRLMWVSTNSTVATIDHSIGAVNLTGYRLVYVSSSEVFRLTLSNSVTSLTIPISVKVGQAAPPLPSGTFATNPSSLPPGGGQVTLTWSSSGADSARIDQSIGVVALSGSRTVTLGASKTFMLTLKNAGGNTVLTSSVNVELPNAGPQDITVQGIPNLLISTPAGNGNHNIEVIRDGVTPPVGSANPLEQYDTYTGEIRSFDWVGYEFASPQTFNSVMFQEGMQFPTGGWFDSMWVQVRVGTQWVDVQNFASSPTYGGNDGVPYEMHDLTFTPATGDAIRVAGKPGGIATFVSAAEIRVMRLNEPSATPKISILAVPDSVPEGGGDVTLHWSVSNAQSAHINGNVGAVPMSGSIVVRVTSATRFELTALNINGTRTAGVNITQGQPIEYALNQNYPNPFNPSTKVRFTVKGQNDVNLTIYDILGQRVRTLFEGKMDEGAKIIEWDGRDDLGRPQSTGTYIYRLKADKFVSAKKMLLIK